MAAAAPYSQPEGGTVGAVPPFACSPFNDISNQLQAKFELRTLFERLDIHLFVRHADNIDNPCISKRFASCNGTRLYPLETYGESSMSTSADISKGRSPRYPRISLLEAVHHARVLYEGAHRSVISSDTAYRVMGFNGKNGSSATALGAVRQFGLVDGLRGDIKIGALALRILEPSDRMEYLAGLREASMEPEVFANLIQHFGGLVPKSDEPIRSYLIRTLNFSRSGADECIAVLRQTLSEMEKEGVDEINVPISEQTLQSDVLIEGDAVFDKVLNAAVQVLPKQETETTSSNDYVRIPLTRECVAELRFSGPITGEAVNRLIKYIDLMKDVWSEN
jgi:hypothetical protein